MLTERQLSFTIGGGAEGDVRVARSVVPSPCHCLINLAAHNMNGVGLVYCGYFKSCQRSALDKISAL